MYGGRQTYNEEEAVGLLQHLDKDELQKLLDSELRLNELINDLPQVKMIQSEREMQVASNRSLAEFNLNREERLEAARQRLTDTIKEANNIREVVVGNKQKLEERDDSPQSLETVLAILQTKAAEAEQDSEMMSSEFLDGNMTDAAAFLEAFVPRRTVAHLRQIKADKLQDIITRHGRF